MGKLISVLLSTILSSSETGASWAGKGLQNPDSNDFMKSVYGKALKDWQDKRK